ncbi:AAA family ATPase [Micromonospora sp. NPDC049523]|uniref:nSTAND1 domain-containing NTPase n=1 Tax=Micromonospora sp. NPDC049523 TaxID=3155921 RepID=UPI003448A5DC
MTDDVGATRRLAAVHTQQGLLDELNRLRITAARNRGKVRLSLQDLETVSGVPKSSLANYLTGRTLMPVDVLDRLVVALGVAPSQVRLWAEAWERVTDARLQGDAQSARTGSGKAAEASRRDPLVATGYVGDGASDWNQGEAAAALREITALQRDPATTIGPGRDEHAELFAGLEGLAKDLAEFGLMVGDVHAVTARLQGDLYRQAADRRDDRDHHLRHAAQLRLIRDGLQVIEQRTRRQQDTDRVLDRDQPPYRGLWPFQEDHADVFYGRERLTAELTGRLEQRLSGLGMLVVTGASGAGKSSLVRAGLLPAIARGRLAAPGSADWPRLIITPGPTPVDELAIQLATLAGVDAVSLRRAISQRPAEARLLARQAVLAHAARLPLEQQERCRTNGRLVLVVDQFEEVFTLANDPDHTQESRQAYIDALVSIATADHTPEHPPGLVLLTVRGDFLDRCAAYRDLVPVLQDGQFVVGPMSTPELRRAITGPAVAHGVRVEDGLPEDILAELRSLPEAAQFASGALPLLSQTMLLTWQRRESNRLTHHGYGATGGVSGVIATSAEDVYARLTEPERDVARHLFERMTTMGGDGVVARRQLTRAELSAIGANTELGLVETVLDAFTAKRLIVLNQESIEIAHDVVLLAWPRLREWLEGDRAKQFVLAQLRQDVAIWNENARDASFLYRGAQLALASHAAADPNGRGGAHRTMTTTEQEFLAASDHHARRSNRIRQAVTASLVTLALVACVGAVASVIYGASADRQRAVALSRQLAAQSQSIRHGDPVKARRLAVSAWAVAPTDEARNTMNLLITEQRSSLIGHVSAVTSVVFSPDGRRVAAGGDDGTIRLWDVATHRPVGEPLIGHSEQIRTMAFSPDGRFLAFAAGFQAGPRLWDLVTGEVADIPAGARQAEVITGISFSPDGTLLAIAGTPSQLWDISTGRFRGVSMRESAHVAMKFSPDGELLAVPRSAGTLLVSVPEPTAEPHDEIASYSDDEYVSAEFSPKGNLLAVTTSDGHVQLWDLLKEKMIGVMSDPLIGRDEGIAFSPDGKFLATATLSGNTAQVWDTATASAIQTIVGDSSTGHTDRINGVAFSPDGALLATASTDKTVRLWDPTTRDPAAGPLANVTPTWDVPLAFSDDGTLMSVDLGSEMVRLRRTFHGDRVGGRRTQHASSDYGTTLGPDRILPDDVGRMILSSDGHSLAIETSNSLQVFDMVTGNRIGRPVQRPPGHSYSSRAIAVSPDRNSIVTVDGTISLNPSDDSPSHLPMPAHAKETLSATFSPDSKMLASTGMDGGIWLWNPVTRRAAGDPLTGHTNQVTAMTFGHDGTLLASAAADGAVRLWDLRTREAIGAPLTGHSGVVSALAFSPDGTLLATVGEDRTLRLWDTATGRPASAPLTGHTAEVVAVAFSPDGSVVATAGRDSTIRLWNPAHYVEPVKYICGIVGPPTSSEWTQIAPHDPLSEVCA